MAKHWDELGGGAFGLIMVNLLGYIKEHSNDLHAIILSFLCAIAGWLGTIIIKSIWNWVFKSRKTTKESE
jgi:hypothetical protein